MGTGATKQSNPVTTLYRHKYVTYDRGLNNITVVYGRTRRLDDYIETDSSIPGSRVVLTGPSDTICIIKQKVLIRNSGIIVMEKHEALLQMEEGAHIEVGANARLVIDGMLLLGKDARLILKPGAFLTVTESMCIDNGAILTIASGSSAYSVSVQILGTVTTRNLNLFDIPSKLCRDVPTTWSEDDKRFLMQCMLFFCNDHRLPTEIIYPLLRSRICQRYGVLMAPEPYEIPKLSTRKCKWNK